MAYMYTITDKDMIQDVYSAEDILLNKMNSRGHWQYNSIRLFDKDNNEVNLNGLKVIVYMEKGANNE